jgi:hypothetical protein
MGDAHNRRKGGGHIYTFNMRNLAHQLFKEASSKGAAGLQVRADWERDMGKLASVQCETQHVGLPEFDQ